MTKVTETPLEELNFSNAIQEEVMPPDPPQKEVELITDPLLRISAYQEIDVLARLITTTFHLPKWDNAAKRGEQPKITGSVMLNYFPTKTMEVWGARILELTSRLG